MLINLLREKTAPYHRQLEASIPLMDPRLSLEDYRQILEGFYGIFKPLEPTLLELPDWRFTMKDYHERLRLPALTQDLTQLGLAQKDLDGLPTCVLPKLDSISSILGIMYVLEGSTLGGQMVIKHLKKQFSWQDANKALFFNSYGSLVGLRWKQFCTTLEEYAEQHPPMTPNMIASAVEAFKLINEWFQAKQYQLDLAKV